jgi:hypothetical protein
MTSTANKLNLLVAVTLMLQGCGLFDTRNPEEPSQSSSDFRPPTVPEVVIENLRNAIAQKNIENYINCLADPVRTGREYEFVPSPEAGAQYPSVFTSWSFGDERTYFQNLIAKARANGFAQLHLTPRSSVVTADSVVYNYDYILTFEHTETGFESMARGNLQFSLAPDNTNFWSIHRWSDFKTGDNITWSQFKGRFSN